MVLSGVPPAGVKLGAIMVDEPCASGTFAGTPLAPRPGGSSSARLTDSGTLPADFTVIVVPTGVPGVVASSLGEASSTTP